MAWTTVVRSPRQPGRGEQLDGTHAVLGDALLDLARLLVGVDVQDEPLAGCVAADLLEPVAGTGADGVGGEADVDPPRAESLDVGQVRGHGRLSHLLEPTPRVRDVEAREADARLLGGLRSREGGVEPEVVELADGGVSGGQHLAVRAEVELAHRRRACGGRPPRACRRARPRSRLRRLVREGRAGTRGCGR